MPSTVLLSVALVTRNRPESLERILVSLRAQERQPWEVIVSDDSDEAYTQTVERIANRFECVYSRGPGRGLYANRNVAFLLCRGTHIRTMDDDHVLPAGHLSVCLAAVQSDPNAIWTTGEHGFVAGHSVGSAATAGQLGPAGVAEPVKNFNDNWAIADGSTIYPRAIFDRGFRMIEVFGFGSSYLEFGAYLYQHGWKSRCILGSIVEHHTPALSRPDPLSQRFASICYNRYFRPNRIRLLRHLALDWKSWTKLPELFEIARCRWEIP
ncbi:MAG: glycosyltransferase [Verrucomicrobia bacterium]|nr:glycosyltransferase [Verrucomicrobiota bacterium]